jgi:hypothetical protein
LNPKTRNRTKASTWRMKKSATETKSINEPPGIPNSEVDNLQFAINVRKPVHFLKQAATKTSYDEIPAELNTEMVPSAEVILCLAIFCVNQLVIRCCLTVPIMCARLMYHDAFSYEYLFDYYILLKDSLFEPDGTLISMHYDA